MVRTINPDPSEEAKFKNILSQIEKAEIETEPPHHSLYRDKFNGVDLHDRYWYKLNYNYQVKNWHTVYAFCLFKVGVINSWVIFNELKRIDMDEYLVLVAKFAINPDFS